MKQVKRSEIVGFIDIDKATSIASANWKLFGNGVTTASYSYNPNNESENWIVEDNARTTLNSYALSIDGEQTCLFGDAVYDFINGLRYNMAVGDDAITNLLLVDKYDYTGTGNAREYKAQVFSCVIQVESYGGDGGAKPTISYTIGVNGDPVNGTVTISDGVPTFTATPVSL